MRREPRRIVVVGAGAIGASVGALLHDAGTSCVLVARGEAGQAMRASGVDLRFPGSARRVLVPSVERVEEAAPTAEDLVLLATMGHATEAALAAVDPAVPVASFQNGLAPLEAIARRGHPTLAAMLYVPAERRGPGVVALAGAPCPGFILLGGWPRGVRAWTGWLAERLARAGFRAEAEADVAPWVRAKLLVNLGGIVAALCDEPAADVVEAARDEARAVWRAAGHAFEDVPALLARVGPLTTEPVDGQARVGGSTRAALARGEPLETATLHGSVVEAGRAAGVATPVNDGLIRTAESASRERWRPSGLAPEALRRLVGLTRR